MYPYSIQVCFSITKRIQDFPPAKDLIPSDLRTLIAYKFTSRICKATYYGTSSSHFTVHFREHLGINKKNKTIKGLSSSITDHVSGTGNSASVEDFCTLDNTSIGLDLLIHESLLILRDRPILNK